MKITYWSDYACPYCYIGETKLKAAIEELQLDNIEIEMKAFELDPTASKEVVSTTVERFAKKYGLSEDGAEKQIEYISKLGIDSGIEFNYKETRYTNTLDAHRLTKLAYEKCNADQVESLIHDLFDAYFTKNLELSNRDLLIEIGTKNGLNKEDIENILNSNNFENKVREDEQIASLNGIHSVPFFIIDGKYAVAGAQDKDGFKKVLSKAAHEAKIQGMSCGINGCC